MRAFLSALAISTSVVVYAQSPSPQRGDLVRVLPEASSSQTPTTLVLRVVAVPGDRLSMSGSQVYVNGDALVGFSADFLTRMAETPERIPAMMPDGHYFVMGEQLSTGSISRYWGQHSGLRLQLVR